MNTQLNIQPENSQVLTEIENYSRQPFQRTLAAMLGCEPTPEKIKRFADKWPDRWGQLVAIFARLSGFSEKTEVVNVNVLTVIKNASDSELLEKISELETRIKQPWQPKLIAPPESAK